MLKEGTKARQLYGKEEISERHRHRYEVNNDYRLRLEEAGLVLSGLSPDGRIVEMIEIETHPFLWERRAPGTEIQTKPCSPAVSGICKRQQTNMESKEEINMSRNQQVYTAPHLNTITAVSALW